MPDAPDATGVRGLGTGRTVETRSAARYPLLWTTRTYYETHTYPVAKVATQAKGGPPLAEQSDDVATSSQNQGQDQGQGQGRAQSKDITRVVTKTISFLVGDLPSSDVPLRGQSQGSFEAVISAFADAGKAESEAGDGRRLQSGRSGKMGGESSGAGRLGGGGGENGNRTETRRNGTEIRIMSGRLNGTRGFRT